MDYSSIYIIILIILLILSAIFSASETAFASINIFKIKNLMKKGNKKAKIVYDLHKNSASLIAAILIGNNIVNTAAASILSFLFSSMFGPSGIVYATIVMTTLVLIIGEITPKIIAKNYPEEVCLKVSKPLQVFSKLMKPIGYLVTSLENKFRGNKKTVTATESELLEIVNTIEKEGVLNQDDRELIQNVIQFDDKQVRDIMTPKDKVIHIYDTVKTPTIIKVLQDITFSRLPVMNKKTGKIVGILHESDFLQTVIRNEKVSLKELIRDPIYISSVRRLPLALEKIQKEKAHMAIVVDNLKNKEFLGIVTLEDILEELVGEIYDEHDELPEDVVEIGLHSYELKPNVYVKSFFSKYLKETYPVTNCKKIVDWLTELKGEPMKLNDEIDYKNIVFKIGKMNKDLVDRIDVTVLTKGQADE